MGVFVHSRDRCERVSKYAAAESQARFCNLLSLLACLMLLHLPMPLFLVLQITDTGIADAILALHQNGVNVSILVSHTIYDKTDSGLAQTCYKTLSSGGLNIRKAPNFFQYSHLKMWVVDGKKLGLSSGNFSPSDYPEGSSFPPYGQSGWQDVNRDANVIIESLDLIKQFRAVRDADWAAGSDWSPYSSDDDYHN